MTTPVGGATDYAALLASSSKTDTTTTTAQTAPDAMGKDAFLKLLVAQLKYQNPMSPMEGNEFLAQSAQFTMLEKLEEIARGTAQQAAISGLQTSTGLLGRKITWDNADGQATSGTVTGSRIDGGQSVLLVGETKVPLAAVREVHQS